MAVGGVPLILLKNLVYHGVCLGHAPRYFTLKAGAMQLAARLGLYEARYLAQLRSLIRPGSDVVDVGANFGAYTLVMSRLAGPSGRVFAFEPLPPAADVLASTCAPLANVVILRYALSGGEGAGGSVDLAVPFLPGGVPEPALSAIHPSASTGTAPGTWKVFRVPVRTLDDHLASFRDVSFIKVDVEGHESAFLTGALETARRFRPVLQLEASGLRAETRTLSRWLQEARYALVDLRGRPLTAADGVGADLNVYAVPQEMMDRLTALFPYAAGGARR